MTLRVVQWTTGNVGKRSVQAVMKRADLELVGCYAWSGDKVGREHAREQLAARKRGNPCHPGIKPKFPHQLLGNIAVWTSLNQHNAQGAFGSSRRLRASTRVARNLF